MSWYCEGALEALVVLACSGEAAWGPSRLDPLPNSDCSTMLSQACVSPVNMPSYRSIDRSSLTGVRSTITQASTTSAVKLELAFK